MHQHEAARAVGVFDHAGLEAGLSEQGALLVPSHAAYGDGMAQQFGQKLTVVGTGCIHLGHQLSWNVQQPEQLGVPLVAVHIKQHGA